MKEFSVTVEVRNNRLKERRDALGISNSELCVRAGICPSAYGRLEKMQDPPTSKKTGAWRPIAVTLAQFFGVKPDDLFPPAVVLAKATRKEIKADGDELVRLTESMRGNVIGSTTAADPELLCQRAEIGGVLDELIAELPDRLQRVVKMRFGVEGSAMTLDEIGKQIGVCGTRVAELEKQALGIIRNRIYRRGLKQLTAIDDFATENG